MIWNGIPATTGAKIGPESDWQSKRGSAPAGFDPQVSMAPGRPSDIPFTLNSTGNNGLSVTNLPAGALGYCFFRTFWEFCYLQRPNRQISANAVPNTTGGTPLQWNGMLKNNTIKDSWTMLSVSTACNEPGGTFTMSKR